MTNSCSAPLNWLMWKFPSKTEKVLILGVFGFDFDFKWLNEIFNAKCNLFFIYLMVTTGYLVDASGYLVVTSGYLIATTRYFRLLLVNARYFWFLVLVTAIMLYDRPIKINHDHSLECFSHFLL